MIRNKRTLLMTTAEKVISGLASEKIKVTFNSRCPVANVVTRQIALPPVPDKVSPEVEISYRSWTDHEVGHMLFNSGPWPLEMMDNSVWKNLSYLIEDTRVDKCMGKRYPGSKINREEGERVTRPTLPAPNGLQAAYYVVYDICQERHSVDESVAYWGGRLEDPNHVGLMLALLREVADELKVAVNCQTQAEVISIAEIMMEKWRELFKNTPRSSDGSMQDPFRSKSEPDSDDDSESGKPAPGMGEFDENDGDAGDYDPNLDHGMDDSDGDEPGKPDTGDEDDKSGDNDDESDEGDEGDGDGEEGDSGKSDGDESDDTESDGDPDGDESEGDGDSEGESDKDAEGSDEGSDESDDKDCDEGGSDGADDDESDKDADSAGGDGDKPGGGNGTNDESDEPDMTDDDADKEMEDLSRGFKTAQEHRTDELSNLPTVRGGYTSYTENDRIERLDTEGSDLRVYDKNERMTKSVSPDEFRADVRSKVGVLHRRLLRDLMTKRRMWVRDRDRGELDDTRLSRVATNDGRVFKRKLHRPGLDIAITLLLDMSGSMSGTPQYRCGQLGYILAETLASVGVPFEVLGFTTVDTRGSNKPTGCANIDRTSPLRHIIIKDFTETRTREMLNRLHAAAAWQNGGYTIEGEAVLWAAQRLVQRREARKVLIVLCDGCPCGAGSRDCDGRKLEGHLEDVIERVERVGIETIGVGIETSAQERFYANAVTYHDPDTLLTDFYRKMGSLLRGERSSHVETVR